jgi:UDP-glucose 4-epimerase
VAIGFKKENLPRANMIFMQLFQGKNALITGGLGFIGSNLAHRLVSYGARVRIVDSALPETGANPFNLDGIADQVDLRLADLRETNVVVDMINGQDYLFNMAGMVSHLDSMRFPQNDLEVNTTCQLSIIEACRKYNPAIKIVYAGTRQIYGRTQHLPVDENHPVNPMDYNGVSKRAGELYHLIGQRVYGLNTVSLRLTNTYGPRMHCRDSRLTFIGDWIRRLFTGLPLDVYGTGEQIRDLNFIDDVVDALLLAVSRPEANGQVYNLGSHEPIRLLELANLMIEIFKTGHSELRPFPPERLRIDIGDYQGDFSKIHSQLGWKPNIPLREGLARTFDYYRRYQEHYW